MHCGTELGLAQGFGSVPPTDTTREDQNPSEKESSQPGNENMH